jgi:AraC-like DNA-binding protein
LRLVHCFLRPPVFPTTATIALKNELRSRIEGIGSFTLKEGEFSFLHYGEESILADFKAEREYQLLEVSCSPELLAQTIPYFPDLKGFFEKAVGSPVASPVTAQRTVSESASKVITDILQSSFDPNANEAFLEEKIRESIWLMMIESSKKKEPRVLLSRANKKFFEELGKKMERNPQEKFPVIHLARQMQMNEMTFKMAFKQIFGKGIFEFHLDQRMKEARRLLKNNLPIKVVSGMVGYELTTSFITKFIEYFGYPPSRFQKNG